MKRLFLILLIICVASQCFGGETSVSGSGIINASTDTNITGILTGDGLKIGYIAKPTGAVVGTSDTQTLTNKAVSPRIATITNSATPTPNADTTDIYTVTALAVGATFGAPTGTPVEGQKLIIRIKDNASAQTLAWNAIYRASSDLALPTTTIISKTLYLGFIYNNTDSKWDLLAVLNNL